MSATGESMGMQYLGFSKGCVQQLVLTNARLSARVPRNLGARPVPRFLATTKPMLIDKAQQVASLEM